MSEPVNEILRELRGELERLYGGRLGDVILYGSHARGDARAWSDIDVVVVLKGPVDQKLEGARTETLLGRLSLKHDVVVSCLFMDENYFAHYDSALLRNIRREGVSL